MFWSLCFGEVEGCFKGSYQLFISVWNVWISLSLFDGLRAWIDNFLVFDPLRLQQRLEGWIFFTSGVGRKIKLYWDFAKRCAKFLGIWIHFENSNKEEAEMEWRNYKNNGYLALIGFSDKVNDILSMRIHLLISLSRGWRKDQLHQIFWRCYSEGIWQELWKGTAWARCWEIWALGSSVSSGLLLY